MDHVMNFHLRPSIYYAVFPKTSFGDIISLILDRIGEDDSIRDSIHLENSRDRRKHTTRYKQETVAQAREETESKQSPSCPKPIACSNNSLCGQNKG
jgi:hypothetical protein